MRINKRGKPIKCIVKNIPVNLRSQKTITVSVSKKILDPKYKRYYVKTYSRLAHYDQPIELKIGDTVLIHECKRISAHKSAICYGERL